MAKFSIKPLINPYGANFTARMADAVGIPNQLVTADVGKLVRLKGESQYGLCAVGDEIEGVMATGEEMTPVDGYYLGSVDDRNNLKVTLDGLQSTPGAGTVAIGDYVVASTPVARGTTLGGAAPKVCKATNAGNTLNFKWRVVSLVTTGVVGGIAIISRV